MTGFERTLQRDFITAGLLALFAASASPAAAADHFVFYRVGPMLGAASFHHFGPVRLDDVVRDATYDVVKPVQLGLPAEVNGGAAGDGATYLLEYKITPKSGVPRLQRLTGIQTSNPCNDFRVELGSPASILLPSSADLDAATEAPPEDTHELDHLLCYKAKLVRRLPDRRAQRFPKGMQLEIVDGFQTRRYDLTRLSKLCLPVDKTVDAQDPPVFLSGPNRGNPHPITPASIRHPETSLLCYKAKPARNFIEQDADGCGAATPRDRGDRIHPRQPHHTRLSGIHVNNQFGPIRVDSRKESEICIPTVVEVPTSAPVPGSFSTTIKGKLASGRHFTRLAMYSFQEGGTMRQDSWYWQSDSGDAYGPTSRRVGFAGDSGYPSNSDQNEFIQGMPQFHGDETSLTTAFGNWQQTGESIRIEWSWGDWEEWRLTWRAEDFSLYKLELAAASYLTRSTYLETRLVESGEVPVNAGWALGGPGPGFIEGSNVEGAATRSYRGQFIRHNSWCGSGGGEVGDESVREDMLNLSSMPPTGNDVRRFVVNWDEPWWVFAYFSKPIDNPGKLARRVMYQVSHDFNGNGHIADDIGHTYSGLEILDAIGEVRGFVFADSSNAANDGCGEDHTISSLYYLDVRGCDSLYGIDAKNPNERCP